MALPKPKKRLEPPTKKDELFVTTNESEVSSLVAKGFHVADQKPNLATGKMVYTFAEPKSQIEKKA